MIVRNNYNECLTNLACSVRKYFDLGYRHQTIGLVDGILDKYKPENVVLILCDGMGSNIIDRVLKKDDFLIRHRVKPITTVFPATTVAATTSIITGLNPVETGMLGWDSYYKELDKVIVTYYGCEKGARSRKPIPEAVRYAERHMIKKPITEEINEAGKYKGYTVSPFEGIRYRFLGRAFRIIKRLCGESGRKYIYCYYPEPDGILHACGCDSFRAKRKIRKINRKVEKLTGKLKDSIVIVIADHGHINVENVFLDDYPDVVDCLERNTSMEPRAVNFFIKDGMKEKFAELFTGYFGGDFDLYTTKEVIEAGLFGDGEENPIFRDELGDFLAIAKGNREIIYQGNTPLASHHSGYTDDEIYVPLIIIGTEK